MPLNSVGWLMIVIGLALFFVVVTERIKLPLLTDVGLALLGLCAFASGFALIDDAGHRLPAMTLIISATVGAILTVAGINRQKVEKDRSRTHR